MILKKVTIRSNSSLNDNETILTKTTRDSNSHRTRQAETIQTDENLAINKANIKQISKLRLQPITSHLTYRSENICADDIIIIRKENKKQKKLSTNKKDSKENLKSNIKGIKPILKQKNSTKLYAVKGVKFADDWVRNSFSQSQKLQNSKVIEKNEKNSSNKDLIILKDHIKNNTTKEKKLAEIINVPSYRNFNIYMTPLLPNFKEVTKSSEEDDINNGSKIKEKVNCKCVCVIF
jgi:hypothetical protein